MKKYDDREQLEHHNMLYEHWAGLGRMDGFYVWVRACMHG